MINENLRSSASSINISAKWIKWLSVFFGVAAVVLGIVFAYLVGQFGLIVLLAIPLLLIFLVSLGQPLLGLIAFIAITFIQLSEIGIQYHGLPSIAQPLAGLLLVLIVIRIVLFGERPEGWMRAGPIIVVFALVWFSSLLHAGNFSAALDAFVGFAKDALGAFIVIFFIQKPNSLKGAIWSVIFAGLLMSSVSIFQSVTNTYGNSYWGFGGWEFQNSGSTVNHRLTGPYANPNAFAQVLVFMIPLAIDRLWHERNTALRLVAGFAAGLGILTIIFTYSRGGFVALLFTISLLLLFRRPNILPLLLIAALGIGVIQFIPDNYNLRILSLFQLTDLQGNKLTDQSFLGRKSENTVAWQMFLDNPILGVGIGNFPLHYQEYSRLVGLDPRRVERAPASLVLEIFSEQGLIGVAFFVLLMIVIFREIRSARENFAISGLLDESYIVIALTVGFAGYLFMSINKNSAYSNVLWVIIGILLAAGQTAYNVRLSSKEKDDSPLRFN